MTPEEKKRAEEFLIEATQVARTGDYRAAAGLYGQCLLLDPGNAQCQLSLGSVLIRLNEVDEAIGHFNKALQSPWDVSVLTELLKLLIDEVQWPLADILMEQIAKGAPDYNPAWLLYADLCNDRGQTDRLRQIYQDILGRNSQNLAALSGYVAAAEYDEGLAAIRAAIAAADENSRRTELLRFLVTQVEQGGRRRHGLPEVSSVGDHDLDLRFSNPELKEYRNAASRWVADDPKEQNAWLNLACAAFSQGDIPEAERAFAALQQFPKKSIQNIVTLDHGTYAALDLKEFSAVVNRLPEVHAITPPLQPSSVVFFLSCDFEYLMAYGRPFLRSIVANAPQSDIHIHVMNAVKEQLASFQTWAKTLSSVRLAISAETINFTNAQREAPLYYHSMRFVRAAQYLMTYDKPLCIMDVDSLMNGDFGDAITRLLPFDIALRAQPCVVEPWSKFPAGAVAFAPTAAGHRYARLVSAYLASAFESGLLQWGIDQFALYACYRYLTGIGAAPRLVPLPENIVDYQDRAESVLWCMPGRWKKRVRLYAERGLPASGIRQSNYVTALRKFSA